MCGFVGFIDHDGLKDPEYILNNMSSEIIHRGPNDSGVWKDEQRRVFMAFRRLSILDLSSAGHQPMSSKSNRYVICFNGEIYNHQEIRQRINNDYGQQSWKGHSDTETLLAAIENFGIHKTLKMISGMFAFVLYDRKNKSLHFSRDRFGEKPLYYGWVNNSFVFGSELKALQKFYGFKNSINHQAVQYFLNYSYIPTPLSIYEKIYKLDAGEIISVELNSHKKIESSYYWSTQDEFLNGKANPYKDFQDGISNLEKSLEASIKRQMVADVNIGAFLSGGIDSSLVTSLMQKNSTKKIKTFTIGFYEKEYDESKYAQKVASFLGTDHTKIDLTVQETLDVIPLLPNMFCEPFADSSQIPTYLVSMVAAADVSVSLSGDGGDELFCGYNRYLWGNSAWNNIDKFPYFVRKLIGTSALMTPSPFIEILEKLLASLLKEGNISRLDHKVKKLGSRLVNIKSKKDLYNSVTTQWNKDENIMDPRMPSSQPLLINHEDCSEVSFEEQMMLWDLLTYLKDDILVKVDRSAMFNSLETRAPFLDQDVARAAFRFPKNMLLMNKTGKAPLRNILSKYLPNDLFERPKSGFGIPIGLWLSTHLVDWVESLINNEKLKFHGLMNAPEVLKIWSQHKSGKRDHTEKLWNILMLAAWLENQ